MAEHPQCIITRKERNIGRKKQEEGATGEGSAYLFDPDIYTDGRISVQGIDAVLLPEDDKKPATPVSAPDRKAPAVTGSRKSKLRRATN
uniref:Uncharacterized protein n=1 Tax=Aegilops tauschii TaxID=37682 RepID=R7WA28_AEGTA